MANRKQRAVVVALNGEHTRDVISQRELECLTLCQSANWAAQRVVQKAAFRIEDRIRHGARVEPGTLTFDMDVKMAVASAAKPARVLSPDQAQSEAVQ